MTTKKIKNFWTESEISILKEHYKLGSRHCMSLLINRNMQDIAAKISYLGLRLTKEEKYQLHCNARVRQSINYKVNPNQFLNIDSPEIAYLLGFIWADGNISKMSYQISLSIQKEDADQIAHLFDRTGEWGIYNRKRTTWKEESCFYISNKIIWSFLKENDYDIKSGASPDKILSKIPENLKHYWWRGYFDGDGSIGCGKGNQLVLASVFFQDWSFCIDLFSKLNILKYSIRVSKDNIKSRHSEFILQNMIGIDKFCRFIYQNYENDNIGLDRKYKKYLLIKQSLLNSITTNNLIEINNSEILDDKYRRNKILEFIKVNNGKVRINFILSLFKIIPKQKLYIDLAYLKRNNKIFSKRVYYGSICYLKEKV